MSRINISSKNLFYPNVIEVENSLNFKVPDIKSKLRIVLDIKGNILNSFTFVEDIKKSTYTVLEIEDFGFICSC
jgi:hypothetical protein